MEEIIEEDDTFINKILVLGNGFDIANCYKTSYRNFILFIKDGKFKEYETNKHFKEFSDIIENNKFIEYFKDIDLDYWADVETEIHHIIDAIKCVYNSKGNTKYSYGAPTAAGASTVFIEKPNPYVCKILNMFRLATEIKNSLILNNTYMDYYNGVIWKEINRFLNDQLCGFKRALIIYLREFVPEIKQKDEKSASIEKIEQFSKIKPNYIITFNYTDFYKNYFACNSNNINHVHGNLNDENIVLGYEDDNPKELDYIRFKKYFQRIQNKLELLNSKNKIFNYKDEFMEDFNEEVVFLDNHVYFYGLSFDITDEDYIKEIYNAKNTKKIYIYYYDEEDYDNKMINLINLFGKTQIQSDMYDGKLVTIKIVE